MPTKEKLSGENSSQNEIEHRLVLFNDDVNTFDHVISSLIAICNHNAQQAEQCAIITHYKGKCAVMSGEYHELEMAKTGLDEKGLTAEIH